MWYSLKYLPKSITCISVRFFSARVPSREWVPMKVGFVIASVMLSVAGPAIASPFKLQPDSPRVGTAQDRQACAAQKLPWCDGGSVQRVSVGDWTIARVAAVQAPLTAKFSYSYDPLAPWRSHLSEAASGVVWADDCDGLTFTVLEALAVEGFAPDKMYRAVVRPAGSASSVSHMVGIVEVEGIYLVVGDSDHLAPYPLAKATFKPLLLSKVSEGRHWLRAALNSKPAAQPQKTVEVVAE